MPNGVGNHDSAQDIGRDQHYLPSFYDKRRERQQKSHENKSFEQASEDLDSAVRDHKFGVLHVHDLGDTLRSKGLSFDEQCRVFEVCNPSQAVRVLSSDMRLNMALPCRISVYTEKGKTKIGL